MKRFWFLNFFWPLLLAGFAAWVFFTHGLSEAAATLARSDWSMALLAFGVNCLLLYFRVFNWWLILRPVWTPLPYHALCLPTFVGYLINSIFPGRVGGLVLAWLTGMRTGMGLGRAFGAILMIRIMDAATLVPFAVLILVLLPGNGLLARTGPPVAFLGLTAASLAALAWLLVRHPAWQERINTRLVALVPKKFRARGQNTLTGFIAGLVLFNHPARLLAVLGLSFCYWGVAGISVFCLFKAFHPELALLSRAYVLLVAQVFAMAVPAPGNVGPYHGATMAVLIYYGVPMEQALMTAMAMHVVMTLGNSLPGLAYVLADQTPLFSLYRQIKGEISPD